jgi:hypothetical protein
MPWQLWPLLLVLLTACTDLRRLLPSPPQTPQGTRPGTAAPKARPAPDGVKQRPISRERCLRDSAALEDQMAELRRSEARLARVKEEVYASQSSPPRWNEDAESRFRQEDRDADWQAYLQAREDWTRREGSQRARWQSDHTRRWQEAQANLDELARDLRRQHPDLFTAPGSIEFDPVVVRRLRQCEG